MSSWLVVLFLLGFGGVILLLVWLVLLLDDGRIPVEDPVLRDQLDALGRVTNDS